MNNRSILRCVCLASLALLLAGCGDKKLTEQECQAIQDKEIQQISSWSDATQSEKWVADTRRRNVASCVAGERYSRKDLGCFAAASTNVQIGRCMCIESAGKGASEKDLAKCNVPSP